MNFEPDGHIRGRKPTAPQNVGCGFRARLLSVRVPPLNVKHPGSLYRVANCSDATQLSSAPCKTEVTPNLVQKVDSELSGIKACHDSLSPG